MAMEVRIAFNELLLNRAKVRVRQDSVRVLDEELKNQQQGFSAGIVGKLTCSALKWPLPTSGQSFSTRKHN